MHKLRINKYKTDQDFKKMPNKKKKIRDYGLDEQGLMGIYAVSLVDMPAIEVDFVALSKKQNVKLAEVKEERRMLYGPILIPDQLIYRVDPETGEEYYARYSAEVCEAAAHLILKKNQHHNVTLMHEVPVAGQYIAELWVKEGESDKSVELGFDLPNKTVFIGMKIEDDQIWQEVKSGVFKGFSIEAFFMQVGENISQMKQTSIEDDLNALDKILTQINKSI